MQPVLRNVAQQRLDQTAKPAAHPPGPLHRGEASPALDMTCLIFKDEITLIDLIKSCQPQPVDKRGHTRLAGPEP